MQTIKCLPVLIPFASNWSIVFAIVNHVLFTILGKRCKSSSFVSSATLNLLPYNLKYLVYNTLCLELSDEIWEREKKPTHLKSTWMNIWSTMFCMTEDWERDSSLESEFEGRNRPFNSTRPSWSTCLIQASPICPHLVNTHPNLLYPSTYQSLSSILLYLPQILPLSARSIYPLPSMWLICPLGSY